MSARRSTPGARSRAGDQPARSGDPAPDLDQPDLDQPGLQPEVETTLDHFETFLERVEDAAIEAEQETGRHEETREDAQRGLLKRIGIIVGGSVVLVIGLLLLALPGPGLVVVALGLGILASEVPFASRVLEKVKKRLPTDADGNFPKSAIVMMVAFAVIATAASTWWALR